MKKQLLYALAFPVTALLATGMANQDVYAQENTDLELPQYEGVDEHIDPVEVDGDVVEIQESEEDVIEQEMVIEEPIQESSPQAEAILKTTATEMIYVSGSGNDSSGDGSQENPYASISKAVAQSHEGDTLVLLSDIAVRESIQIFHSLTLTSADSANPFSLIRQSGFAQSVDNARRYYNPAMIELHGDRNEVIFRLENVILNDNFLSEGTSFTRQTNNGSGGNTNKAQDAIVALYQATNKATFILGAGATLKNYGGMSAVTLNGTNVEFIMEEGSKITSQGGTAKGTAAVYNNGGHVEMKKGSTIEHIRGAMSFFAEYGTALIDGTISNGYLASSVDNPVIKFYRINATIGENAKIFDNESKYGAIYAMLGATLTVRGEIYNNKANAQNSRASGIYVADNGASSTLILENGAYIHDNKGELTIFGSTFDSPFAAAIIANNTSKIIMNGGKVADNKTAYGIVVRKNASFTMNGGEISGNNVGVNIGLSYLDNYADSTGTVNEKVILNDGIIQNNGSNVLVEEFGQGGINGNYIYVSPAMIQKGTKVSFTKDNKKIASDPSMKEMTLANANADGQSALQEVAVQKGGTLLATWYGKMDTIDSSNRSKFTVEGITASGDVFLCAIPLDDTGKPQTTHSIYLANRRVTTTEEFYDLEIDLPYNANGYVFGLFNTLTSPYSLNYVVHYETFGADPIADKDLGSSFTSTNLLPSVNPSLETKRFVGWYTDTNWTKQVTNSDSYASLVGNNIDTLELTLYAKYEEIEYIIHFDGNGADQGDMADIVASYSDIVSIPNNNYVRDGYNFKGFNTKKDGTGNFIHPLDTVQSLSKIDGDIVTLYAMWAQLATVTFNSNGGSPVDSQIVEVGQTIVEPQNPTRVGYDFVGWFLNEVEFDFNDPITRSIELVAKWNPQSQPQPTNTQPVVKPEQPKEVLPIQLPIQKETVQEEDKVETKKEASVTHNGVHTSVSTSLPFFSTVVLGAQLVLFKKKNEE